MRGERFAPLVPTPIGPMSPAEVHAYAIRGLAQDETTRRYALIGCGVTGDTVYIPTLISQMAIPEYARVAGEAFSMITGVDLAYEDLDTDQPEGFEAGPTEDPADENVDLEVRANAIFWLGQMGSRGESTKFLIDLYADLEDEELKDKVIFSVAQSGGRTGGQFLMDIVRDTDEDVELRNNALFWLGQTDRVDEEELVEMISSIDEPELAEQVVFVLSQRGGKAAVDALIQLARGSEDPDIREKAIFWLGQSGDPRAAEYLEELVGEDW